MGTTFGLANRCSILDCELSILRQRWYPSQSLITNPFQFEAFPMGRHVWETSCCLWAWIHILHFISHGDSRFFLTLAQLAWFAPPWGGSSGSSSEQSENSEFEEVPGLCCMAHHCLRFGRVKLQIVLLCIASLFCEDMLMLSQSRLELLWGYVRLCLKREMSIVQDFCLSNLPNILWQTWGRKKPSSQRWWWGGSLGSQWRGPLL